MIRKIICLASIFIFGLQINLIDSHGRLLVPPARTSAWREDPARFPSYFDDAQMFCGGFQNQWGANGGQCGICGEDFNADKLWEKGGKNYRGYTVRTYAQGETIDVTVEITANHKGYFEFRLCDVDQANNDGEATQACLNKNVLKDKYGRIKVPCLNGTGKFPISLVLPKTLSCKHCVFQWKYNTGNSWNIDPTTKIGCMGCGPQENFYGCSDIEIKRTIKREWEVEDDIPEKSSAFANNEKLAIKDTQENTMVSKGLLKRLYNELKRLKTIENSFSQQNIKLNSNQEQLESSFEEKQVTMVGEPLFQTSYVGSPTYNDLTRRGFEEKIFIKELNQNNQREVNFNIRRKRNV